MSLIYVIAEIGNNHNGSVDKAIELIDMAAAAGADAVKFQSSRAFAERIPREGGTAPRRGVHREGVTDKDAWPHLLGGKGRRSPRLLLSAR